MNKIIIENALRQSSSIRKASKLLNIGNTALRYWIKKLNINYKVLLTDGAGLVKGFKKCPRCQTQKLINQFYTRRNKPGSGSYCIECSKKQASERQRSLKQTCVNYKGGKCMICGYDRCPAALEFHHRNPNEKDSLFAKKSRSRNSTLEKIKPELDKCDLLCSNCHREAHYLYTTPDPRK